MSERYNFIFTVAALTGAGLVAGVFFGFSTFIMRALFMLPPAHGIRAMQNINVTVITPIFMAVLFGTAALSAWLGLAVWRTGLYGQQTMLVVAALSYVFGVIGITIIFNIPLNDSLAALDPESANATEQWWQYVTNWTRWNSVRCAFACFSMLLYTLALYQ